MLHNQKPISAGEILRYCLTIYFPQSNFPQSHLELITHDCSTQTYCSQSTAVLLLVPSLLTVTEMRSVLCLKFALHLYHELLLLTSHSYLKDVVNEQYSYLVNCRVHHPLAYWFFISSMFARMKSIWFVPQQSQLYWIDSQINFSLFNNRSRKTINMFVYKIFIVLLVCLLILLEKWFEWREFIKYQVIAYGSRNTRVHFSGRHKGAWPPCILSLTMHACHVPDWTPTHPHSLTDWGSRFCVRTRTILFNMAWHKLACHGTTSHGIWHGINMHLHSIVHGS